MNESSSTGVANETDGGGSSNVWGVVLAAGMSSRFGDRNKLLEDVDGQSMVRHVTKMVLDVPLANVVTVVGYQANAVRGALEGIDVAVRENECYDAGQIASVREGVAYASAHNADIVLIALRDMPYVSPRTITALVAADEEGQDTAIAAAYDGERRNPSYSTGSTLRRAHVDNGRRW